MSNILSRHFKRWRGSKLIISVFKKYSIYIHLSPHLKCFLSSKGVADVQRRSV